MAEVDPVPETHAPPSDPHAGAAAHHHAPPTSFIRKYVFSVDHKVIGIQYLMLALFSVFIGMFMSVLMRMNLTWPGTKWPILETLFREGAKGGVMTPEFYLSLVTMHGTMMVFFVLTTAPQGGFGNYMLPIQVGADDMAFPRLNMLSFWVTFVGLVVLVAAIFAAGNGVIGPTTSMLKGWLPEMKMAATSTSRPTNVTQNESMLRTGKAMSSAPIWIGRK